MAEIVGRERELAQIEAFVAAATSRSRALHLHGAAGVGKTALWQRAVRDAADRGYRVLVTRPTEAEARLPFAGLTDLLGELFDEHAPSLPEPQRMALGSALLRSADAPPGAQPLAVSLGALAILREGARAGPVLLAIDDAPWLDESTATALEFVLRRLDEEPVAVLTAERTVADDAPTRRLVGALSDERSTSLRVAPLSAGAVDRLLATTLGLELPPTLLKRVHRASGGNPLYAIEIGRALSAAGALDPQGELPIPEGLAGLLRDRLDALSAAATDVVELSSALSQPTTSVLAALLGAGVVAEGVEEAVAENIIVVDGEAVRFTHPLLAAELYAGLPQARRRALHRRLAEVTTELEERARHVALAADGPDEQAAQHLERAAERASSRGAPDAAASLVGQAITMTTDRPTRIRRLTLAAHHHLRAGDIREARTALEEAESQAEAGDERAAILLRLGEVRHLMDDWTVGERLFRAALAEVAHDTRTEVQVRLQLGGVAYITGRNWAEGAEHVFTAMRLADELADPALLARTAGPYLTWRGLTGQEITPALEERARELSRGAPDTIRAMDRPEWDLAAVRWNAGDIAAYEREYVGLLERAERMGDYSSLPFLLANLTRVDFAAGRPEVGFDRLERAERLARATGQGTALGAVLAARTRLLARLGRADEAWTSGNELLRVVVDTGWIQGEPHARRELAMLELSRRDPEAAWSVLEPFGALPGPDVPWVLWQFATHAETLIALGRLDEAQRLIDAWRAHAPFRGSAQLMRASTRAEALLAAAAGAQERADELLAAAEAAYAATGNRWAVARTDLVAAEVHRRARRRGRARDALARARETFDHLGAALWAAYAGEQLERIQGARDADERLTATQLQVAELAAQGLTNRQIGDRLFMSPHTVEAHLTTIYRSLEIRGRAGLGDALHSHGLRAADGPSRDTAPAVPPKG